MSMSSTVLYMSMSLDGFIAGPNEGPGNGLGDRGERLHEWVIGDGVPTGADRVIHDEAMATGAIVCGRGTYEPAGGWGGDHHDGVPVFLLTRDPGAREPEWPNTTYLSDVAEAMRRAKEAAGDRDVLVHGAGTAQLALAAGVLDELQIHLIPVLLGEGRPLFEHLGADHIELEGPRVVEGPGATHLRYRVRR